SQKCPKEDFKPVKDLNLKLQGESFWVRGHLQVVRAKTPFFNLRERMATIQAILHESDKAHGSPAQHQAEGRGTQR
ncbi:hypothetical protein F444_19754, partial [Phytophthora nicotianae P1976]